ncbi:hypothetical protein SMETH9_34980 [Serratia marcescens]|nr:hypothetical protein SMETH9_34980 [Serratia marcescens]
MKNFYVNRSHRLIWYYRINDDRSAEIALPVI